MTMLKLILNNDCNDGKKICGILGIILFILFSFSVRAEEIVDNNKKKDKINIKSDKVEYNYKESVEVAVFTGNVELKQGELTVYSDIMNMYAEGKKAIGENNVKVIIDNEKENRVLTSGYIEYHRDEGYALLKKSPKMVVINKKQKSNIGDKPEMDSTEAKSVAADKDKKKVKDFKELIVVGEVMEMFSKEGRSRAVGNVVIEEGDRKAYCDEAVFYEKEDKVIMTGSPKIIQKDNVFKGEKMTFFLNEDRFIIEGKVDGTIIEEKKE